MSSALADQIAAGEVVERPASVVKELVENALDAGARRIDVEIEGGGRRRVHVVDDGEGMAPEDARLALRRHATSKLARIEDLESLVTMGFRGEALPSIAAVSRLALVSRPRDRATAFRVDVAGGLAEHEGEVGAPPGTQVDVRDLFWNVPARLKFLKAEGTESAHVSEWVTRLALARPEVHLRLVVDGREVLDLPPAVDRSGKPDGLERARAALGRRVRGLWRAAADEGGVRVEAFVAAPDEATTTQRGLFVLVNRRFVKDRNLAHAVLLGYGELVPRGRWPVAVVHVSLPEAELDVNVHPQKIEVRFRSAGGVYAAVRHAIARLCAQAPWTSGQAAAPRVQVYTLPPEAAGVDEAAREAVSRFFGAAGPRSAVVAASERRRMASEVGQGVLWGRSAVMAAPDTGSGSGSGSGTGSGTGTAPGYFAELRYIGQLHATYLVCESEDELVLIDQHAAHERVAFQKLRAQHAERGMRGQRLLFPLTVPLEAEARQAAAEHAETLARLGFEVELEDAAARVRSVPEVAAGADAAQLLGDVLGELGARASSDAIAERVDHALATMACHSVIRAGDPVTADEVRALLAQMDGIDYRTHCPHGRPVLLRMRVDELARRVGR